MLISIDRLPSRALLLVCTLLMALLASLAPVRVHAQTKEGPGEPAAVYSCAGVSQIPSGECQALVELYRSTGGRYWTQKAGWLKTSTPCSWHGVRCSNGHVVKLNLRANNLNSTLPAGLSRLRRLQVLNLESNTLYSPIPDALGQLRQLRVLRLGSNTFSGAIPSSLGNLTRLQYLDLSFNELRGPIPPTIGSLASLRTLDLGENQLTGTLPISLTNLTNLVSFNANANQLSGSLPERIDNLTQLRSLSLGSNQLSGPIPASIGNLSQLESLYLSYNQLSGSIPETLAGLPKLFALALANNNLSGSIPAAFGAMTSVDILLLHDNMLSGPVPASIVDLGDIYWLSLGYNMLEVPEGPVREYMSAEDRYGLVNQTVPPADVQATSTSTTTLHVSWAPLSYMGSPSAYYEVGYATTPGGPYTFVPTDSLQSNGLTLSGLAPATSYWVVVRSVTPAHTWQHNTLVSVLSPEVTAATMGE